MKKQTLLIFASLLIISVSHAQRSYSSLSLLAGVTEKNGLGGMINYTYSQNNSNYEFAILHSQNKDTTIETSNIQYNSTTLNIGYLHTVIRNNNNSITVNIGLGIIGGYENIPPPTPPIIIESKNGLIAGGYGVLQTDFYISDTISILLRGQQNYYALSTTGKFNPFIALGIKFNL